MAAAHHALVVVVTEYDQHEPLPLAAAAATAVAERLEGGGFRLERALLRGGESRAIGEALNRILPAVEPTSTLFLYWTGHGVPQGSGHYLLARESPRANFTQFNAVDAKGLGDAIALCPAEKILVLVDTCYSGAGAAEIARAIAGVLATIARVPGRQRAIAVIASTSALELAREGVFGEALRKVLFDTANAARRWTDRDQRIHTDYLAEGIRLQLSAEGEADAIEYKADGTGQEFVPNPRYQPNAPAENVEERSWRIALAGDDAAHFDSAGRGIEVGQSGWFFGGRKRLLRSLVAWLKAAPNGVRIVTGPPGAGKSAVNGRLATLSDPEHRRRAEKAGVVPPESEGTVPPIGVFDVAIHAKGKTIERVAGQIAEALGIEELERAADAELLAAGIAKLGRRVTMMIDALDEASTGNAQAIARSLIVPLSRVEGVRILVGTRRSLDGRALPASEDRHSRLRAAFGGGVVIDDLEDEAETADDISDYVKLRLRSSNKHRDRQAAEINAVADRVAANADGIFLYARILSRTLQEMDHLDGELPATATEAFVEDLHKRFGEDQRRVNDLLAALAWGEGGGLTRRVWPLVANAVVGESASYGDEDVAFVLSDAGWHIIEAGEDGQAVYRLAHQALADHYLNRAGEQFEVQARIVAALRSGFEGALWLDADRYLWRHLAVHAVQAGLLGLLIEDPGYLAIAHPPTLVALLPYIQFEHEQRVGDIYNRVADRLKGLQPIDRMPLIHMTALSEDPELSSLLVPVAPTSWGCRWANIPPTTPHRILGHHGPRVTTVAFGDLDGIPVVASGSDSPYVSLWDARSGEQLWLGEGHEGRVNALVFGRLRGRSIVVSGSDDCTIRLWDALSGKTIGNPFLGHRGSVTAVAFGRVGRQPVIISGSFDTTIALWSAMSGEQIMASLSGHVSPVSSLSFGEIDERPFIASGSKDGAVCLWDVHDKGASRRLLHQGNWGSVQVAFGTVYRTPIIASSSDTSNFISIWNARSGYMVREGPGWHLGGITSLALGRVQGRWVLVSGGLDRAISVQDVRTGEALRNSLKGHTLSVNAVAVGSMGGYSTIVSGGDDATIRLWDVQRHHRWREPSLRWRGEFGALAFAGDHLLVSGSPDGTIRKWHAGTGEASGRPIEAHDGSVSSLASGEVDGRAIFASGGEDGVVRLWNLRSHKAIRNRTTKSKASKSKGSISALAFGNIGTAPVVISSGSDLRIRIFDARSAKEIRSSDPIQEGYGRAAIGVDGGEVIVAMRSSEHAIRVVKAATGNPLGRRPIFHNGTIHGLAVGSVNGFAVVAAACGDGLIRLWDGRTGEPFGNPLTNDPFPDRILEFGVIDGRAVIAASARGVLRVWDAQSGGLRISAALPGMITAVCLGRDGQIAVVLDAGLAMLGTSPSWPLPRRTLSSFPLLGIPISRWP